VPPKSLTCLDILYGNTAALDRNLISHHREVQFQATGALYLVPSA
jgi:hypothetical protein